MNIQRPATPFSATPGFMAFALGLTWCFFGNHKGIAEQPAAAPAADEAWFSFLPVFDPPVTRIEHNADGLPVEAPVNAAEIMPARLRAGLADWEPVDFLGSPGQLTGPRSLGEWPISGDDAAADAPRPVIRLEPRDQPGTTWIEGAWPAGTRHLLLLATAATDSEAWRRPRALWIRMDGALSAARPVLLANLTDQPLSLVIEGAPALDLAPQTSRWLDLGADSPDLLTVSAHLNGSAEPLARLAVSRSRARASRPGVPALIAYPNRHQANRQGPHVIQRQLPLAP